jgi:hypothetical protein
MSDLNNWLNFGLRSASPTYNSIMNVTTVLTFAAAGTFAYFMFIAPFPGMGSSGSYVDDTVKPRPNINS